MEKELRLMKGNEAVAEAAIRAGADGYFGYPITPQSEILEYLMAARPWETTGMVVLQAESEVASINMLYGGAGTGKMVMTSSSSPARSGAELPCLIVNVVRGGPGLGTIQPAQSDYFQAVKGGGHGDYHLIVLAPASVQEMADFVDLAFELAFKYRNPAMILSDGAIGQMMEKVWLGPQKERSKTVPDWATTGKPASRERNIITSLDLDPDAQEIFNQKLIAKYDEIREKEVRYEEFQCEDAEYLFVAYGTSARVCMKSVQIARAAGMKVGLLRPITLFPFPSKRLRQLADKVKMMLSVEMSAGQMIEDVLLSVNGKVPVYHFGRMGGIVTAPEEVVEYLKSKILGG
ncbi:MAG: 3-methyl-2-oxobutanoate dehydrogenase subunit VorB [Bacteroidales bacterium]|nr:3-methyl-2-oxobutanoate dehydrogenase subunit VorB [Bacteroidales bacterium]